jgi:hypothetical protein
MPSQYEIAQRRANAYRQQAAQAYQGLTQPFQLDQSEILSQYQNIGRDPNTLYQLMLGRSAGMPSRQALMRSRDSAIAREQLEENQVRGGSNYYNAFLQFNQEAGRQRQGMLGLLQQGRMFAAEQEQDRRAFGVQRFDELAARETELAYRARKEEESSKPFWQKALGFGVGAAVSAFGTPLLGGLAQGVVNNIFPEQEQQNYYRT